MVGIGVVGIGFMGMIHFLAAKKLRGGRVVAVCSRDPKKLAGDWTSIQGNFGPRGGMTDLSGVTGHPEYEALLRDPAVDLVDLCVPNDEHARLAVRALEAGKHVLVEKPIALTTADADAMLRAAEASGRMLMVAHVLPFFPEFAFAAEAVRSQKYGKLHAAHLTRVISRPDWSAGIGDASRSGGPAIDLHIHDTHFLGLLCGTPKAVRSCGVERDGAVSHLATQYLFDDPGLTVSAISGASSQKGRPFAHGFDIYLEGATLAYGSSALSSGAQVAPLALILPDGTSATPPLADSDPIAVFATELEDAVSAVERGEASARLSGELARQALAVCLAEVESVRSGEAVTVN